MARKSGFVRRNNVMRRESLWIPEPTSSTTIAAASTAVLLASLNAAALALRPFTIVRVRGVMHVRSDQVAASETFGVSMGQAVVSDQASAIGVTAVPTPETDRGSDLWHVYESVLGFFKITEDEGGQGMFLQYDSKGMRKVEDGEDSITVLETASITTSAIVQHSARFLIKLH